MRGINHLFLKLKAQYRQAIFVCFSTVVLAQVLVQAPLFAQEVPMSNTIQKIEIKEEDHLISIVIQASQAPSFNVFKLSDPVRLMIDIARADVSKLSMPMEVHLASIVNINAMQLKDGNQLNGRVMIELKDDAIHFVKTVDDQILIQFPLSQEEPAQARQEKNLPKNQADVSLEEAIAKLQNEEQELISRTREEKRIKEEKVELEKSSQLLLPIEVQNIQFENTATSSIIKVQISDDTEVVLDEQDQQPTIIIKNAQIPTALVKKLDARDYQGPVAFISSFQAQPREVHVAVDLQSNAPYEIKVHQRVISLIVKKTANQEIYENQGLSQSIESSNAIQRDPFDLPKIKRRAKKYTGKKINLNVKDADIHSVVRSLAQWSGVNIVMSDDITGTVSIVLKQVPWDQALEIILKSKALDYEKDGNIIRIAPRETIAAERKADIEKNQIKEKLKPIMIRLITVNHASGQEMVDQVKNVLSERGSVNFDQRTNTLIIKDVDVNIDAAEDLVRRLDTQTPQVLIEARIVEVNKVNEKEFGIQWGGQMLKSTGLANPTGLYFPSAVGIKGGADDLQIRPKGVPDNPNFIVNLPATVGVGSGGALGLSLGSVDSAFNLNVRLSAAANRGTVKIISSPKITTLDNKIATISQGVSIPISQISAQGVQTTFFDATLKLEVTPHVTQDGNIYLQLKANNDTPDFQNVGSRGDPTILKKQASTQVLLKDGETTVIGGIYTSNSGTSTVEFPILGQIPILGVLFRNDSKRTQRNELLIFITPRVVNRNASQVNTQ